MVIPNEYEIGDRMRMKATFDDGATPPVLTDPTTVTLTCYNGDGTVTSWLYGVDIQLIKDSTGKYRADWVHTATGDFSYRWVGAGGINRSITTKVIVRGG